MSLVACDRSGPEPVHAESGPEAVLVFTAEDAARLQARIDEDPDRAVVLLEETVAASLASMSDEQFERFRARLVELLDQGRLQLLVEAGRERPATAPGVARLIDDLEAWDASILRGFDGAYADAGYTD